MRALVAVAGFSIVAGGTLLPGQNQQGKVRATQEAPAASAPAHALRVTHVSLYKNGVGFFEHEGTVVGNAAVRLDLTSAQLNDVLQSLTALDLGGGHITGANYNSTTPLEQQLATLPLSLGQSPSQEDLFRALRGARVAVSGSGAPFTGRILSLEIRPATPDREEVRGVPERRLLTIVADEGATRTVELTPNTVVHLLDAGLRGDLNTYLQLLDRNRTEGVRHLTLTDFGSGTRVLHVSYLSEVPVWKSTYRLLLTTSHAGVGAGAETTATLQGFSVVDNTTGEDWNDVQLSLIAGSPQSFLQPIAQPIYVRRPEVPIAQNVQTAPQTHESAEGTAPPPGSASADLGSSAGGNPVALSGSPTGTGSAMGGPLIAAARRERYSSAQNATVSVEAAPAPMLLPHAAAVDPAMIEELTRASNATQATTAAFDDFFAYNLTDPVTIPRNGSALVPILQARLPAESVTLWSAREPRPLRALWLTNSSAATLDRGSFAVLEDGAFAGEGLVDAVHPGERRLLSYAADQAVRVVPERPVDTMRVTQISVSKGVLHAANTEVTSTRYTVDNAAPVMRTVVVETERRPGWILDASVKPAETTPGSYRFRLVVQPHAAGQVTVTQRHILDQYFRLADTSEEQLTLYLSSADPKVTAELEPVFAAKRKVADLLAQMNNLRTRERALDEDQKRLRENLAALKASAEERSLVRRYTGELNAQEDALAELHRQMATLQEQESAAQQELSDRIAALQITEIVPSS